MPSMSKEYGSVRPNSTAVTILLFCLVIGSMALVIGINWIMFSSSSPAAAAPKPTGVDANEAMKEALEDEDPPEEEEEEVHFKWQKLPYTPCGTVWRTKTPRGWFVIVASGTNRGNMLRAAMYIPDPAHAWGLCTDSGARDENR